MPDLVGLAAACAILGWFVQAIIVDYGVRFFGRPKGAQTSDYEEPPHRG